MSSSNQIQTALILPTRQGSFTLTNRPIPTPGPNEILVKVKAISLNPLDWKIQTLGIFLNDSSYPAIIGCDAAGDVIEVGKGVTKFVKGDRVFFDAAFLPPDYGAFQEYALAKVEVAAKIPQNYSYAQAATIPLTFATAATGLFATTPIGAGLTPVWESNSSTQGKNKSALVIGGSSSVGQYVIQLLKSIGFTHIITYASSSHASYLTSLGATSVIDRTITPLADLPLAIAQICGDVDITFDTIGGKENQEAGFYALNTHGQLITVRLLTEVEGIPKEELEKRVFLVLGSVNIPKNQEFGKVMYEKIGALFESGVVQPLRFEVLEGGLSGIVDGLERLKSGKVGAVKLVACL